MGTIQTVSMSHRQGGLQGRNQSQWEGTAKSRGKGAQRRVDDGAISTLAQINDLF